MPVSRKRANRYQGKGAKARQRKERRVAAKVRAHQLNNPINRALQGKVAEALLDRETFKALEGRIKLPEPLEGTVKMRDPGELFGMRGAEALSRLSEPNDQAIDPEQQAQNPAPVQEE